VSNLTNLEVWRIQSPRKILFLLLNPALFLTGFIGSIKGFVTGHQRYSVNK
jgi:hypothetical protein